MKRRRRNGDLPEELLREILLGLSVKDLLRCKCVCKRWRALIRSQSFIDGHFNHESNRDCLLLERVGYGNDKGGEFAMYPDDERHLRMDASNYLSQMSTGDKTCPLMGPANGVFCVVRPKLGRVALFNPATRKFKLLPPIPLRELKHLNFGFGFDSLSGDYKVVVFETEKQSRNFFGVYKSSCDSWRKTEIGDSLNDRVESYDFHRNDVVLNGVCYWFLNCGGYRSILGFDLRSENFHEILLPDAIKKTEIPVITAYGDSIALMSHEEDVVKRCVNLWVVGRDGSWSKSFSIAIDLPQPVVCMWPLCVWNKKELLLKAITVTETGRRKRTCALFKCDIATQKLQKFGPEFGRLVVYRAFSYKESLVSIEGERDRADCIQDFLD